MQIDQKFNSATYNIDDTTIAVAFSGTNLFGPQSRWSLLLGQRENLLHEIARGNKYLERLRKDLAECGALLQNRPVEEDKEIRWLHSFTQQAWANDDLEQFLLKWLERLEEQVERVNREITALETPDGQIQRDSEESMFELLRAAG
jgi:hypothetical protein